jgi:hypothetical protein
MVSILFSKLWQRLGFARYPAREALCDEDLAEIAEMPWEKRSFGTSRTGYPSDGQTVHSTSAYLHDDYRPETP